MMLPLHTVLRYQPTSTAAASCRGALLILLTNTEKNWSMLSVPMPWISLKILLGKLQEHFFNLCSVGTDMQFVRFARKLMRALFYLV